MKRGFRALFCIFCSLLIASSSNFTVYTYAMTENECIAGGVRYYDCVPKKCNSNRSCDASKADSVAFIGDLIGADAITKNLLMGGIDGYGRYWLCG